VKKTRSIIYSLRLTEATNTVAVVVLNLARYTCVIRVVNDVVVGRKDPEVDHHTDCEPLPASVIEALKLDRQIRHQVSIDTAMSICYF